MQRLLQGWVLFAVVVILLSLPYSLAIRRYENKVHTSVFLSPKFELGPGSVVNHYYYDINFPRGHIALKSFNAEVIDEAGNPIPLHETYLHHWVVGRYFYRKGAANPGKVSILEINKTDYISGRNQGICQEHALGQYYGLGSETRKTATHVPDPFGIEVGNSAEIPSGYDEKWMLNIHAIDTRGAVDKLGCTECRCDLYNVTVDEYGRPLRSNYTGGLLCCYDNTQCKVREGFFGQKRSLYLRYTVKWVDWDDSLVPVKVYILDVTDTWKGVDALTGDAAEHECHVEYEVNSCDCSANDECIDVRRAKAALPTGGYVVYGVAHQHTGGVGSALYGQDGRVICSSIPTYGEGKEAGNEAGYIVGMSTCYPELGSARILDGESLTVESNYSSTQKHTGVMGLFYILVAEKLPKPFLSLDVSV